MVINVQKKVLLVTANEFVSSAIRVLLNNIGDLEIEVVSRVRPALSKISRRPWDLVLIDEQAPGVGTDACRKLVFNLQQMKTPSLVLDTADVSPEEGAECLYPLKVVERPYSSKENAQLLCESLKVQLGVLQKEVFDYLQRENGKKALRPSYGFGKKSKAKAEKLGGFWSRRRVPAFSAAFLFPKGN